MEKRVWLRIFILTIIIIAAAILFFIFVFPKLKNLKQPENPADNSNNPPGPPGPPGVVIPAVKINQDTLPAYLQVQQVIKEIPKDGIMLLKLFNSESGEWVYGQSYVIKKASVVKGTVDNPDIIIMINENYVPEIGDFCAAVKKAKENGDIAFGTRLSKTSLMWKYKSMMKYKDCFGL